MATMRLRMTSVLILAALGLSACGSVHSGGRYDRRQAGEAQYVSRGVIVAAREVQIDGERSGLGTIGGGVIGGVGGSMIGRGGRAHIAGAAAGAILGAVIGALAESQFTKTTATEFTVREDSGQLLAVVQANDEYLNPGERVVVLRGSRARVVRDAMPPASGAPMIFSPPVIGAPPPTATPVPTPTPPPSMPPIAMPAPPPQPPVIVPTPAPALPPPVGTAPPAQTQPTPTPPTTESKPSEQTQAVPTPSVANPPATADDDGPQLLTGPLPRDPVIQGPTNGNARRQPLRS